MRHEIIGLFAAFVTILPGIASAATAQERLPAVEVMASEKRDFESKVLGQNFELLIAKPLGPPRGKDGKYPVIYLLDADIAFPMVRQIALSLQGSFDIPPAIIVGVGYGGGFREGMKRRTQDYTPTQFPAYATFAAKWEGGTGLPESTGGADKFLNFFRSELKPFIEENYPADASDSTIFGSSFGGLFAAYALLKEPDTFQRYILSSPSLWWDHQAILRLEESTTQSNKKLSGRVFVAAGSRETAEYEKKMLANAPPRARESMEDFEALMGDGADMIPSIDRFIARLNSRNHTDLELTSHIFPDETHASTPPVAVTRGLRVVFGSF